MWPYTGSWLEGLKLLGQKLTKILSKNKKIMAQKMDLAARTIYHLPSTIKQDLGLRAFK
jgi:hypothetical protein